MRRTSLVALALALASLTLGHQSFAQSSWPGAASWHHIGPGELRTRLRPPSVTTEQTTRSTDTRQDDIKS